MINYWVKLIETHGYQYLEEVSIILNRKTICVETLLLSFCIEKKLGNQPAMLFYC